MRQRPCWMGWNIESKRARAKRQAIEEDTSSQGDEMKDKLPDFKMSTGGTLLDFKRNSLFHDAVLILNDGSRIPIHRAILSAASPYFMTMFTTSLTPESEREFSVPGISSEILSRILDYAYSGEIMVNEDNVFELFHAADYLGIESILDLCCTFIKGGMSFRNCIGVLRFARQYKDVLCRRLTLCAYRYLMQNFTQVALESDELLDLDVSELQLIISCDDLNVRNEQVVWETVLRWIGHDEQNRKPYLMTLMECIRFGMMQTEFFIENVKRHPWIEADGKHNQFVIGVLKVLYELDNKKLLMEVESDSKISRPRIPNELMFAIGGWSGGSATQCIEVYDTKANVWIMVPEVDTKGPRAYHGTVFLGEEIYVIGGFDGQDQYYNSCRCFHTVSKVWREIAPMNYRRCYVSVACVSGMVYAMGGYDGVFRRNTAEKYNVSTNQWTMIAPMNVQRSDAGASALNGRIYIVGGFDGSYCLKSAEVYDPGVNQWTLIPPMLTKRSGVSCIAYHGSIHVLGGFNGTSRMFSCEKFNPTTNVWTKFANMFTPRSNFGVAVMEGMIFVVGGFNGVTTVYRVECYDDSTNQWYEAADMHLYRSALSVCIVQGLDNMSDYINKPGRRIQVAVKQKILGLD